MPPKNVGLTLAQAGFFGLSEAMELHQFSNSEAWLEDMVARWKELGGKAVRARGTFYVALSGGNTPRPFYEKLARSDWPWSGTHLFIGDERVVPAEDPQSNYRMIYRALYPHLVRLERWKTELPRPEAAAREYSQRITQQLGYPPRFDLILLGIGDDGHTASLFPGTSALHETERWTAHNFVPQLRAYRLTFTYRLFDYAREVWFLARGASKRPWIERMVSGPVISKRDDDQASVAEEPFPAARVKCHHGPVRIFFCEESS